MLSAVALGLGWPHAVGGIHPIPQGTWDLVPPHRHFQRAVCAICGLGGPGGPVSGVRQPTFRPLQQRTLLASSSALRGAQGIPRLRGGRTCELGLPRLPRTETSLRGRGWSRRPLSSPERPSGAWTLSSHPTLPQKASTRRGGGAEKGSDRCLSLPGPAHFECREPGRYFPLAVGPGEERIPPPLARPLAMPRRALSFLRGGWSRCWLPTRRGGGLCPCKVASPRLGSGPPGLHVSAQERCLCTE